MEYPTGSPARLLVAYEGTNDKSPYQRRRQDSEQAIPAGYLRLGSTLGLTLPRGEVEIPV